MIFFELVANRAKPGGARRAVAVRQAAVALMAVACGTFYHDGGALAEDQPTASDPAAPMEAVLLLPPTAEQITQWIAALSDDEFTVRRAAAEHLLSAGMSAREALRSLVDNPEPETRAAARRLIALIDRAEFRRRLDAFAADVNGQLGVTLPGWEQFRDRVGNDPAGRALFVEMQRQEAAMLSATFSPKPNTVRGEWENRMLRMIQWQGTIGIANEPPSLGSCASMLFLGIVPGFDVSDQGAALVESLIQRPPIRESLQAGQHRDALRRLVVAWIVHCPNDNEEILRQRLYTALISQLREAVPWAVSVAVGNREFAHVQPVTRAWALLLIGQLGGAEQIDSLQPLLEDTAVCSAVGPGQPNATVQIRDVALVMMLHLSGQQPADYGYAQARIQPQQMFQLQAFAVDNDRERARAIAKWRVWRKEQRHETRPHDRVVGGTDPSNETTQQGDPTSTGGASPAQVGNPEGSRGGHRPPVGR